MLFYMVVDGERKRHPSRTVRIDEELLERIGRDDNQALAELYESTYSVLSSYVLSLVCDPDEAQDLVQETYLKIRASAHLYKRQGKPLAWIFTIAKNLARNSLRQTGKTVGEGEENWENDLRFSYVTDPSDRLVLEAALSILNEEERSVLLLHAVSGVRHHEIAKDLGIPLSTALSRYHRALKKLKKHLQGQEVSL